MKLSLLIPLGIATLWVSGCATIPYEGQARDIKLKPRMEGVIGIPNNPKPEDRNKAEERMRVNCGAGAYEVLEEGEVVVGQETTTNARQTDRANTQAPIGKIFGMKMLAGDPGGQDTKSTAVTTAVKEWQISYKCVAGKGRRAQMQ